jgi:hypothetical protein
MKSKSTFLFLLVFILSGLSSDAWGWSWRDLKPGSTTIEDLLDLGGLPETVTLLTHDFLELPERKIEGYKKYVYSVCYFVSNFSIDYQSGTKGRRTHYDKGKAWYDSSKTPILTKAPLELSDEVDHIKMEAYFANGKLRNFQYDFSFPYTEIDKKKYVEIFNALLGKPIQIKQGINLEDVIIEYKGYSVSIFPRQRLIRLISELSF